MDRAKGSLRRELRTEFVWRPARVDRCPWSCDKSSDPFAIRASGSDGQVFEYTRRVRVLLVAVFVACVPPAETAAPAIDPSSLVLPQSSSAIAANEDLPTVILT